MIPESTLNPERLHPNQLTTWEANPNIGDLDAICNSLERFGQRELILYRRELINGEEQRVVYSGNHRLEAARHLGWEEVAAAACDDLDPDEIRALGLAMNRTRDLATYDDQALAALLESVDNPDLLASAGFDDEAVTALLDAIDKPDDEEEDDDELPLPDIDEETEPVTQPGDIWLLGPHRIMCGDCRNADDVKTLLNDATVNLAFTSPPYADRRAYDETSGFKPIPPSEYVEWFKPVQANVASHLADDGSWIVNIKAGSYEGERELYVADLLIAHKRNWGWRFVDEFCWQRVGMPGSPEKMRRFKNAWESVFHFTRSRNFKWYPDAVKHKTERSFVYDPAQSVSTSNQGVRSNTAANHGSGLAYPSNLVPTFGEARQMGHTAAFPVGLPDFFVRAYTDADDTVYDPFMGSGSTLLAAHQNDRVGYGMEISPRYCDVICSRYQAATGTTPVLESTGQPHNFQLTPEN